ncbi:MAG: phosphonate metabolism transcriptional regulator PhnF [Hyphomicrobiales bacterium]|nr:phosphonate metabolism transcriptional regulator PhnF [Hyphomicrobiales bacterium]
MKRAGRALPSAEIAGVALWRRVADHLEHAIADGRYPVDTRLPGEIEIAQRLGVNRHTVRRAIARLADRGFVRAERGSGTYVETRRLRYPIHSRTRFSEIVGAAGREPGGRLLASAVEEAEPDVARRLGVAPRTAVIRLEILRSVDRAPVSAATTWLPADRAPDAGRIYRDTRSLTRTLAQLGVDDFRRQSTRISAAIADAADAARLRLAPGRPLIVVDSTDITADGRPILTTRARLAADRIELVIET